MAIGVIVGVVFSNVVNSLVSDIAMPWLGVLMNGMDLSELSWKFELPGHLLKPAEIRYGAFLNAVINFVIVSGVIFAVIKAMSRLKVAETEKFFAPRSCPECLMPVPNRARKCSHCCSEIPQAKQEGVEEKEQTASLQKGNELLSLLSRKSEPDRGDGSDQDKRGKRGRKPQRDKAP
jgi:large conductance mechanosensitive channel